VLSNDKLVPVVKQPTNMVLSYSFKREIFPLKKKEFYQKELYSMYVNLPQNISITVFRGKA
jgi:hypothetical protein